MKRALIAYFSQGGTTAKIGAQIAQGIKEQSYDVDLYNIQDQEPRDINQYDIFGIGFPVYIFRPPFNVTDYLKTLPDLNGKPFFVFLLYGGAYTGTTGNTVREILATKGGKEVGYSSYKGENYFIGYLKKGFLFSAARPTEEELARAYGFGKEVVSCASGNTYEKPPNDPEPPLVFKIENMLTIRSLVSQIYTYTYRVKKDTCNACEVCVKTCPVGNITMNEQGFPQWGKNCISCWYCQLVCPMEAITSWIDWPIMIPFIKYNIGKFLSDPAINNARVALSKGKVKRL